VRVLDTKFILPVICLLVYSVLFSPSSVSAESTEGTRIYVVNMQQVINESRIGVKAREAIESEIKKREKELEAARNEIQKAAQDLQRQASVLSSDALAERQEALKRKERDFTLRYQDQRGEVARRNEAELGKVIESIRQVVNELGDQNGYPLILDYDRYILYSQQSLDLTPEVISILNSRHR